MCLKVEKRSNKNDIWMDDIPQSQPDLKGCTYTVYHSGEVIFVCRVYNLTEDLRKQKGVPKGVDRELGDVYLWEKYRGMKMSNGLSYSFAALHAVLRKVKCPLFLWVTKDNYPAIALYKKVGFKRISDTVKRVRWVKEVYGKENPWVRSKSIVFMRRD